ncbi:hypothetical protein GMORB2_7667 [Geosmithia morbida]|uniref:HECT-type E3 ubiquitin transferase n=1 Tax=Geosmithia morbida TaxID=1094350 RepID=A0A9P5D524_9HYPO|nr:uncharacterized protein GMORB2_7667 [Geosmithia morbida]KAF4122074.1 hypothetical protein GMORB2_7667 [Geosmithia morbida]
MSPASGLAYRLQRSSESAKDGCDPDLLAGLWQEAPFARLPSDAPDELRQYLVDIDDPRRIYVIHRASRRHRFQELVGMYINQLRYGCGAPDCTVPTCFTCRKRLAGKAPIRRYSQLSARTLAVYLASQDDPEKGLCLAPRQLKDAPKTLFNDLAFEKTSRDPMLPMDTKRPSSRGSSGSLKSKPGRETGCARSPRPPCPESKPARARISISGDEDHISAEHDETSAPCTYKIQEKPTNKDHRSFAANLFGTVAFRMFEWLTPQGLAAISNKLQVGNQDMETRLGAYPQLSASTSTTLVPDSGAELEPPSKPPSILNGDPPEKLAPPEPLNPSLNPSPRDPTKSRRAPESMLRSPQSASKPRRRASLEPVSPAKLEEPRSPTKSPRPAMLHPDKLSRPLRSVSAMSRGIPEMPSKPAFFGNFSPDNCVGRDTDELTSHDEERSEAPTLQSSTEFEASPSAERKGRFGLPLDLGGNAESAEITCPLPQSLSSINIDIIEFFCNVFNEDNTGEHPVDPLLDILDPCPEPLGRKNLLVEKKRRRDTISRRQWKVFNEQTLFHVLSSPHLLLSSFMSNGDLFDSHTLWYCMFRLIRAVPSLVFHSLWMAADSLFVPPKGLQNAGPGSSKLFKRNKKALTEFEAGCLMSICLHALAGSVPSSPDKHSLRAISWNRSKGLTVTAFPDISDQPAWVREQFEDALSHDLAIRLARRLCCAVTARRQFAHMVEVEKLAGNDDDDTDFDILDPLFNQIDLLGLETAPVLEFSEQSRRHHQGRMQMLILEWARAVMFHEWHGRPDFSTSGPFSGALSVIESMYDQRDFLQLVDRDFHMHYFSERLDSMEVAVSWLGFTSTSKRRHLLDYPYLFTQDTLVSFFRSINFSRMSRAFEESSSLKTRMSAIVDRGSLITNTHHKTVLQDMLKTASERYMILEISRNNVIRDAFDQLWQRQERELLRPLKVHLGEDGGEEGFDSGGVQQEFFRMAVAEFLDADCGAFTVDDRTRMAWFMPGSVVELWKYELFGILVSIAVFNGLTLPVTFPRALYRKLLDWPVTELHHLEDGWPDLTSGLTMLQEWDEKDGTIEDVFARTYEFSVSAYGSHVTRDMNSADENWPQFGSVGSSGSASGGDQGGSVTGDDADDGTGEAPLVTKDNRDEYITDYIRFLADVSVRPQYAAFEKGFRSCLDAKSLRLLSPNILQSLVEGVQEIDVAELRRYTRYVGWDASHRTVRDFWSIVKRYDETMKRKLLEFVTASDRLPVGGVRNLQFVLQKNGAEEEDGHLPTAYTCYGTLLLPEYKDKEVLRERLAMALENAQGFGFA